MRHTHYHPQDRGVLVRGYLPTFQSSVRFERIVTANDVVEDVAIRLGFGGLLGFALLNEFLETKSHFHNLRYKHK